MDELLNQYRFLRSCGETFSHAIEMLSKHYKVSEEVIMEELENQEEK